MGVAVGDYDDDGCPDLYVTSYGKATLYHNNGDGTFTRRHGEGRGGRPGLDHERGLVRLRQRRPARPLRRATSWSSASTHRTRAAATQLRPALLLHPADLRPMPSFLFHNNGDGTFTDVSAATGFSARPGQGPGGGGHRLQQRRPPGPVRGQRHRAELPVDEPRAAGDGRRSASPPRWGSRPTASRDRAWAWTRPTSTPTAGRTSPWQHRPRDPRPLHEQPQGRVVRRRGRAPTASPRPRR